MKHTKPTKEQIQADLDKSLAEIEKTKDVPADPEPEVIESKPETVVEPVVEPDEPKEPADPVEPDEPKDEPKNDPETLDYKKKFIDSAREGQILHSRNKKMAEAIELASSVAEPTEEEMVKEYPEWDLMDEVQKKIARKATMSDRRMAFISEAHKEAKDIETWNSKVDGYIEDPRTLVNNPELEGREEEFKMFATKPTRRGADLQDLINSFLWDMNKTAKPKSKGAMFESHTPGPSKKENSKSGRLSIEEATRLRTNNYNEYVRQLKSGNIESVA